MVEEEKSIQSWVLEIQSWGFPPRITQLQKTAEELLQAKAIIKNWAKIRLYDFLSVI